MWITQGESVQNLPKKADHPIWRGALAMWKQEQDVRQSGYVCFFPVGLGDSGYPLSFFLSEVEKQIVRKREKKRDILRKSKDSICILKKFQKSVDKAGTL